MARDRRRRIRGSIDRAIVAQTSEQWWAQPTEWENYGDVHPEEHGGMFLRWEGNGWHHIETRKFGVDVPEEIADTGETHMMFDYYFYPEDVFRGGDPGNGLTSEMMKVVESLGDEHLTLNWWREHPEELPEGEEPEYAPEFKENFAFYIPSLSAHIGDAEIDHTGDYWGYLEHRGIERDRFERKSTDGGAVAPAHAGEVLDHDDIQEIKRMMRDGASPGLVVNELGLKGKPGAVRDIERELSSLAPGSMGEYRNFLERMADEIEDSIEGKVKAQKSPENVETVTGMAVVIERLSPDGPGNYVVRVEGAGQKTVDTFQTDTLNFNGNNPFAFANDQPGTKMRVSASSGAIEVEHWTPDAGRSLTTITLPERVETKVIEGQMTPNRPDLVREADALVSDANRADDCSKLVTLFDEAVDLYAEFIDAAEAGEADRHAAGAGTPIAEVGNAWVITRRRLRDNGCISEDTYHDTLSLDVREAVKQGNFDQARRRLESGLEIVHDDL